MPLLTDNIQVTLADLRTLEPELPGIAEENEIIVEGPLGIIRDAWEQCADQLVARCTGYGGKPDIQLFNIVATDPLRKLSSLQRWMAYQTLVLFFRAATARIVNDRYSRKLELHETALAQAWAKLRATGLQTIAAPLPCPAAAFLRGSGEWGESDLAAVGGGAVQATSYDVAITYVDGSRSTVVESGPSATLTIALPASTTLRVSIARAIPPARVTGWNIYLGSAGGELRLQTASPVSIDTTAYALPAPPFPATGRILGTGQSPDGVYQFPNIVHRA